MYEISIRHHWYFNKKKLSSAIFTGKFTNSHFTLYSLFKSSIPLVSQIQYTLPVRKPLMTLAMLFYKLEGIKTIPKSLQDILRA